MKNILIAYIILINVIGFTVMGIDKRRARKRRWRIPERRLFAVALGFGSIGILVGMYVFRHKTKHRSFLVGVPLILALQLLLVFSLSLWHSRHMKSPTAAVEKELSLIRELDPDTISSFVSFDNLTYSHIAPGDLGENASQAVHLFFENFDYQILREQISGDEATVTVNITNLDMHALAQDLCEKLLAQTMAIYPDDTGETAGDYYELLSDTLAGGQYEQTVTAACFHLKREGSIWSILADEALEDELVSGFISYLNDPYIVPASTVLSLQLDALKALDAAQWKDYLRINDVFATYNTDYAPQIDEAYTVQLAAAFDYRLLKCQENGSEASATVRITSLDMSSILARYKKSLIGYASTTKSIRDNDVQVSNETSRLLLEAIQENMASCSTDVDLTLHNNGKAWELYFDETFTNAIMGDIDTALTVFNEVTQENPME